MRPSKQTARRSELAGWAEYGYCASHSRYFWGLRLHLVVHPARTARRMGPDRAKADERQGFLDILAGTPAMAAARADGAPRSLIGDKNYYGHGFEAEVAAAGIDLLRPARKGETERPGAQFFKPLRQIIESINQTLKGQLDLERHGGRTPAGICARVGQRILALTAAIWHNDNLGLIDAPSPPTTKT